jgi:signal transduction histidine kinase
VQQILAFGRRQPHQFEIQPLRPLVEETLALLRSTLPARVMLERVLADQPVVASVDGIQFEQVLMNLCTNAWHALRDSTCTITVGLDEVELDAAQALAAGALLAGRYAHLWVRDTGVGMDAAPAARARRRRCGWCNEHRRRSMWLSPTTTCPTCPGWIWPKRWRTFVPTCRW